jgi:hypothetical protein
MERTSSVYSSSSPSAPSSCSFCSPSASSGLFEASVRTGSRGTSGSTIELARIDFDRGCSPATPFARRDRGFEGVRCDRAFGLPTSDLGSKEILLMGVSSASASSAASTTSRESEGPSSLSCSNIALSFHGRLPPARRLSVVTIPKLSFMASASDVTRLVPPGFLLTTTASLQSGTFMRTQRARRGSATRLSTGHLKKPCI